MPTKEQVIKDLGWGNRGGICEDAGHLEDEIGDLHKCAEIMVHSVYLGEHGQVEVKLVAGSSILIRRIIETSVNAKYTWVFLMTKGWDGFPWLKVRKTLIILKLRGRHLKLPIDVPLL